MKTTKTSKAPTPKAAAKTIAKSATTTAPRKKSVAVARAEVPASPVAPEREITNDLIAARAYVIWEQQGRPHGRDRENWLLAETQLKQEIQSFTA
jgi:hypothetical protein